MSELKATVLGVLAMVTVCVIAIVVLNGNAKDTVTAKVPLKFPTEGCVAVLTNHVPDKTKPYEMIWYNRCELEKK